MPIKPFLILSIFILSLFSRSHSAQAVIWPSSIPIGSVITIEGRKFVKIDQDRYQAAFGINPPGATPIAAGETHTCALSEGKVYCWGYNEFGQLGNNSTTQSNVPVAVDTSGVLSGKTVSQISATGYKTCVLSEGKVYCWGRNNQGQLGNNSTTNSNVPVTVDTSGVLNGLTIDQIAAGALHTCALASGKVYCWGYNGQGQLGNNSTTKSSVPVAVNTSGVLSGLTVTQIDGGNTHTCAIASGKAYCWGGNGYGQLGNNSTTDRKVPVAVDTSGVLNGKTVTQIAGAEYHTCALASGKVYCWGDNVSGQLGNNSITRSSVPVAVDTSGVLNGLTVSQIDTGAYHTCALASGKAYCWGYNNYGQLGNNSITRSSVPIAVDTSGVLNGLTVTQIATGYYHTCALASGKVYCWGYNPYGGLGNNSTTDSSVPVAVNPFPQ
jgi:alpha-tubulin suppressor-like RCC1 family protein